MPPDNSWKYLLSNLCLALAVATQFQREGKHYAPLAKQTGSTKAILQRIFYLAVLAILRSGCASMLFCFPFIVLLWSGKAPRIFARGFIIGRIYLLVLECNLVKRFRRDLSAAECSLHYIIRVREKVRIDTIIIRGRFQVSSHLRSSAGSVRTSGER